MERPSLSQEDKPEAEIIVGMVDNGDGTYDKEEAEEKLTSITKV